jgi:hypothetical protein
MRPPLKVLALGRTSDPDQRGHTLANAAAEVLGNTVLGHERCCAERIKATASAGVTIRIGPIGLLSVGRSAV